MTGQKADDGEWDRRRRDGQRHREFLERLGELEQLLGRIDTKVDSAAVKVEEVAVIGRRAELAAAGAELQGKLTNGRVSRNEQELTDLRKVVHGDPTRLSDPGGIVGTLRQTNVIVRLTAAAMITIVVPAALTILGVYLTRM